MTKPPTPIIAAVLFSYRDSAGMIAPSIWSVIRFAEIPPERIMVADDTKNPMTPVERLKLTTMGVTIVETSFDRRRNLNGYDCVKGVLETLDLAASTFNASYILKIDPDTMLFSPEIIERLDGGLVGSIGGAAGTTEKRFFYGMAYVIRKDIIAKVLDFVNKVGPEKLSDHVDGDKRLPEDYTISSICSIVSPATHVTIPFSSGRGFHCSWPYGKKTLSPLQTITSFCAIHFGQWHLIKASTPSRKRSFAGSVMAGCQKMIQEWDSNASATKKCMAISFGGFRAIPEAGIKGARFTPNFNSTFIYDLLPTSGAGAPLLSAFVDQEFEGTNNEGVNYPDPSGEERAEQVEVHIYRSAWASPEFFLKPAPAWYRGGMCAIISFSISDERVFIPFHEHSREKSGTPILRDKEGRTIVITRTEEKPWLAQEDVDKHEEQ